MNETEIKKEARMAANRSQFKSNHSYDHKSYEDGFIEGFNAAEKDIEKTVMEDVTRFFRSNILRYCSSEQMEDLKEWINGCFKK